MLFCILLKNSIERLKQLQVKFASQYFHICSSQLQALSEQLFKSLSHTVQYI